MISSLLALTLAASSLGRHGERGWTVADGLPQASVTAIAQDREGWLHLGTFGGLVRFDGNRLEVHGASEGVGWASVRITALAITDDGTQWLGVQSGHVVRIDPDGTETQLPAEPRLAGKAIWALQPIGDTLWVAGSGGVATFDGEWTTIDGVGSTRAILARDDGVWLGGEHGLAHVEDGRAVVQPLVVGALHALLDDGARMLVAGDLGVIAIDGTDVQVLESEPGHDLVRAADGTVYVAAGSRVRVLGQRGFHGFGSRVRDIFLDREQVLWVGTDVDGLRRLVREDWTVVDVGGGALPVLEVDDGALLVGYGCEPGGIMRVASDDSVTAMAGGCVRTMARRGAEILVGVDDDLAVLQPGGSLETLLHVGSTVQVIRVVGDDVLVGTDTAGAFRLHGTELRPLPVVDRRVLAIEPGPGGALWFGGQDGLTRLVGDVATRWARADDIPAAEIRALHVDGDGTVLLGSYGGGMGILRDGVVRRLTRRNGLDDDVVSAILDDGHGALWLHGNRGVTRLVRADLEAWWKDPERRVDVRRWATPEGNGGGQPAGVVMRDGSLALPTVAGLVRLDPRELHDVVTIPSLTLLHAEIDGLALVPGVELEVPAGPGRVELEFTSAILRHPELATFEYRVTSEASDTPEIGWHRVDEDRRIRWAGFPAGRHRIELRVANESGVYSPPTTLRFVLAQAWHERWSVRIGIVLAIAALFGGLALWRLRLVRRHLVGLQREIDQRLLAEAEARALAGRLEEAERLEAVGRLAGGIAHDFNNLFAAIRGATSMIASGPGEGTTIDEPVRTLDASVDRGARLTGALLSFARRQHLDADAFDLCERLDAFAPTLAALVTGNASFRLEHPARPLHVLTDAAALELAVSSLVRNADEAVGEHGSVVVRVFELDGASARARWTDLPGTLPTSANAPAETWVVLEVVDDGLGIAPERLSKVLEPFYSTRSGGAGLGLPSALGFALQSGGTLRIASQPGVGTTVSMLLPKVAAPRTTRATPTPAPTTPTLQPHRIVVVDDDELVGNAIGMILRRAGHHTVVYRDPRVALHDLQGGLACDLLVSDILMPGLTGSELADAVLAARPDTPILFVSGFTRDVDASLLPGALLAKPFRSDEVLRAVEAAIAGADDRADQRRGA